MDKKFLCLIPLVAMGLASCTDTSQLYAPGQFLGGTYESHEYAVWEGSTKQAYQNNIAYQVTLQNEKKGYFCGNGSYGSGTECWGYDQAKAWHPEWFKNSAGNELLWGFPDSPSDIIHPEKPGEWVDNSSLYEVIYSQNKRLDRFYEKFSRGYLSKFYNGQIKCNGWSYYAMAVISNQGYGTMFPYELNKAEYFGTSLLVSTNHSTFPSSNRVVEANIHFTFYKYAMDGGLIGHKVTLNDVHLSCDASAARTSFVGFSFADAGIDPKSIVGMSVTWDLVKDSGFEVGQITNDFSQGENHDGLSIYEVFFPDSVWL